MIVAVIHDDMVGHKETFYKGPFATKEEAEEGCARFNADHPNSTWSAWVIERDYMPEQEEWEKRIFNSYFKG